MTAGDAVARRARALDAAGVPFVEALVVRAQRPTSARPGARAVVLADGSVEGFVGGTCTESSLRLHAQRVLGTGEPLLLKILPGDEEAAATEGAVSVSNPCLSGGALEIFLEPHLPAPRLVVLGDAPIARALAALAEPAGFELEHVSGGAPPETLCDAAVVVASHGVGEEALLERALRGEAAYVGLVASRARGADVVARLDVAQEARARVHTPAGLDLGARTPQEVAVSILAEIVAEHRRSPVAPGVAGGGTAGAAAGGPASAVDPVCGMQVAVSPATPRSGDAWFCGEGCRERYEREASGRG